MSCTKKFAAACAVAGVALAARSVSAYQAVSTHPIDKDSAYSVAPSFSQPKASKSSVPPASEPDRHGTRGLYLARTALTYRGMAYRWGGRSAATGFDCSGLVQAVCAKWGIYLPRVASAQYHAGVPVSRDQLQPGDLVFFKNTYKRGLSHVGIYIGNSCFIHAAGRAYGVCVGRLDSGYHKNHWAGARRLNLSHLPAVPGESSRIDTITVDTDENPWANEGPSRSAAQPTPAPSAPVTSASRQSELRVMQMPQLNMGLADRPTADRPASLDRPFLDRPRGL